MLSPSTIARLSSPPPATSTPCHMDASNAGRRLSPGSTIGGESHKMNHSEEGHVSPAREGEKRGQANVSDIKNKGERQGVRERPERCLEPALGREQ